MPRLSTIAVIAGALAAGCGPSEAATGRPPPKDAPVADAPPARAESGSTDQAPGVADDEATADGAPSAPAIDGETAAALEALGYFPSAPTDNPEDRGVTVAAPEGTPGLNLYSSRHSANAILIDMSGREVHRWSARTDGDEPPKPWMHVEPLPGGDLLVITKAHAVSRIDWDSEVVWQAAIPAHHDLAVRPDGGALALIRWADTVDYEGTRLPILADGIAFLSPEGEVERRAHLVPVLEDELSSGRLERIRTRLEASGPAGIVRGGGLGDVLHTNSIEILPRDIEGVAPAGSLLLSFRAIDRVMIVDAEVERILWRSPGGLTQGQHDATILDNDHFLIFDNGSRRGASRVIELDPVSGEVVWQWGEELYTQLRGGAQRLASGNVLLTESDSGRALEVTPSGEIVWEFHNPEVRGEGERAERGVIYRLNRFDAALFGRHD